ncbi:MAG TPA: hypothetical protein VG897_15675, partial [Terriglobales bacterium]|nr:hypothetical protein [Terriglobales bacterium]
FKSDIDKSLQTLEKELLSNQEREIRLKALSKAVAEEIGSIVVGLQFQDIINQRLQHAMAALPRIESTFEEIQIASNSARSREALQFVDQSCRLEAGQLEAARAELEKAESSIQSGVQKVLSHLLENDSQCLSLKEFKLLTSSFEGIVQVLVDIITKLRGLVEAAVASAARAFEVLKPLRSFASELTAVVRGMSAEIHLIGLNAQVQAALAARDPRGAALEVLSARTNEISHETNRISEGVAAALDTLATGLAESVKSFEALRANGLEHQNLLNEQGRAKAAQLHAFRDNALSALVAIGTSLDEIRERAGHALAAVEFSNFHDVELPALRQPLLAIADTAMGVLREQGYQKSDARLIEGFKRDYTMASEREVHAKVVSSADSTTFPQAGADAAMWRVELFTERNGATLGEKSSPPTRSDVAPFEPAAWAPVRVNELGSNVELF